MVPARVVGGAVIDRDVVGRLRAKTASSPGGCWLWMGSLDEHGYGQAQFRGRLGFAHRVAYTLYRGEIPDGLELDHLCRVTACINPWHLEAVTHKENLRRSPLLAEIRAKRLAITHCPHGHPYDVANTYIYKGRRNCRACGNLRRRVSR